MADSYVCSGAMMRCTMGTSPANLTVLPVRTVNLTGPPMANISDHKSMVNLAPFGLCRSLGFPATASATAAAHGHLTPMPCMHNTPTPWMGGKMDYLIKGQPALLKSCKCQCMWGGTISLVTDGQVGEGVQYVQKKSTDTYNKSQREGQPQADELIATTKLYNNAQLLARLQSYPEEQLQWIVKRVAKYKKNGLNSIESIAKAVHDLAFIKSRKSTSMDDNQADLLHSNPNYGTNDQYGINCATTTTAFMLRKQGFDVTAKARNANAHTDSIAYSLNLYDVWRNPDGSAVSPTMLKDEFTTKVEQQGLKDELIKLENTKSELLRINNVISNPGTIDPSIIEKLTIREKELKKDYYDTRKTFAPVYKEVLMDACQEEGYYTFGLVWEAVDYGGGHYTVIKSEKDKDGNIVLTNIEPQNGRPFSNIDTLVNYLDFPPDADDTIMRTDDKVFNEEYNDLFDIK